MVAHSIQSSSGSIKLVHFQKYAFFHTRGDYFVFCLTGRHTRKTHALNTPEMLAQKQSLELSHTALEI
jgi:hypothetical protein